MNLRPLRLVPILFCVVLSETLLPLGSAEAAPVDDKRAQAAQLQSQIDANGRKIDALSEAANGARYRLDQATVARDEAQARIAAATQETARLKSLLTGRAVSVYKGAGSASPLDAMQVGGAQEFAARSKYAAAAASKQNKLVDQLRSAQEQLTARKHEYETAIAQAQAEQERAAAARSQIEAANATQAQLLGQVKGEIATLVQQEEQRKQAEAAARARALTAPRPTPRSSGASGSSNASPTSGARAGAWSGPLPAASGGAAAAVAFAKAQLGKPYVYAAAGPDAYDCSGLTMRAWQAGGVSMPHYSGAQMAMFPRVPMNALQPGDLIFWGPGGSNHVAMYEGGGTVIYAPQTGSFVKEGPIYGSPSGAVRPG